MFFILLILSFVYKDIFISSDSSFESIDIGIKTIVLRLLFKIELSLLLIANLISGLRLLRIPDWTNKDVARYGPIKKIKILNDFFDDILKIIKGETRNIRPKLKTNKLISFLIILFLFIKK